MRLKRSHTLSELSNLTVNETVTLNGWINTRRDLGGIVFADLRDRDGLVQIRFDADLPENILNDVKHLATEDVIAIKGIIQERPNDSVNTNMASGKIEISVQEFELLNKAKTTPFEITKRETGSEDLRLKYRYLDLRTAELKQKILFRHRITHSVRTALNAKEFVDIETPLLMKSTPEGARDFLVPSRMNPGKFYALPQSPQTYKQLLMISGYDKYYQIVKCFRDEDLRADRQPEFTQIDIEMSFVDENDVMTLGESLLKQVVEENSDAKIDLPLPRMTYNDAMEKYGSDKPDTRFDMLIENVEDFAKMTNFGVFLSALENKNVVRALKVPGGASYSRKKTDELTAFAKTYGAKGLAFVKFTEDGFGAGISKFINDEAAKVLIHQLSIDPGDLVLFMADTWDISLTVLGALRLKLAADLGLLNKNIFNALFVTDFPLLEYDDEAKRFVAKHHPFTSPKDEDIHLMESDPAKVRAKAYDLVLNGNEIAGGSIRIYQKELQQKMFELLNISEKEAEEKFGFLLEAFEYGAPPHGGIAFGLDRMIMILAKTDSIREVIAFPKTTTAQSPMDNAPDVVAEAQLKELKLKLDL